jgi:hypothetical protein
MQNLKSKRNDTETVLPWVTTEYGAVVGMVDGAAKTSVLPEQGLLGSKAAK